MKSYKGEIVIAVIVLLSFAVAGYCYPQMPEQMASHWNMKGEVDGYMSKFWGLFLLPFVLIGISLLLTIIPRMDPLRANVEKFKNYYYGFVIFIVLFLFYIYLLTLLWNSGTMFNMMQVLSPAFGVLFYCCGVLIEKAKRNWFIGIRTPWTLTNDRVWENTHRICGKLFKLAGMIALLGVFFPDYAIILILAPVILFTVFTTFYSYFDYHRETR